MNQLFDLAAWREIFVRALSELGSSLAGFLPNLVGALFLLGLGWLVARFLQVAARRGLRTLGLDRASARLHFADVLERADVRLTLSEIIGVLLFWLVMLTFLLSAVETLGLSVVTATLDRLVAYIPNLIGAGLLAVLGLLFARFAGSVVGSTASAAGLAGASRLGFFAQAGVVVLVVALAAEQVGVAVDVLVGPLTALLGAAGLAAGLAFALGAHPIVTHILAGHFLKQSLPRQGWVEVNGERGMVERVGATETLLRDGERSWSVPNAQLLDRVVVR